MSAEPCVWHDFGCESPATQRCEDGVWTCSTHVHTRIAGDGSFVPDRHGEAS